MKKIILLNLLVSISVCSFSAETITGLWKSVSDETNHVNSITLIYEYQGKIFGRLLVTYDESGNLLDSIANPQEVAENVKGDPFYAGLDFIWNMQDKGKKWSKGKIMDPEPAKVYSCDMWLDGENLVVRGKIGPFGRNQTWLPLKDLSELPSDVNVPENLTPQIPQAK